MKSWAGLLFMLMIWGCGQETDHEPVLDVGEFLPVVERFEASAKASGLAIKVDDLRIRFGRMDSPYDRGICEVNAGESPTITLKKSAWILMTEEEREALLFHEMGHCILRRKHNNEKMISGLPASLMYPFVIDRDTYVGQQQYYVDELFSQTGEF